MKNFGDVLNTAQKCRSFEVFEQRDLTVLSFTEAQHSTANTLEVHSYFKILKYKLIHSKICVIFEKTKLTL